MNCPLCNITKNIIFQNDLFKVILVNESGYVRVISNRHIKELSELSDEEAINLTLLIKKIEKTMLKTLKPDKINIASLGNKVPHLHIHIIPRYKNDEFWPNSPFSNKEFNYPTSKENLSDFISLLNENLT